jgi:hypothetical protein
MNELKILGVDANVYFKNIEYYIKNPRKTHFRILHNTVKLHKEEYVNVNKTQGKNFMNEVLLAFTDATKVVISDIEEASHILAKDSGVVNMTEMSLNINDFKPMLKNYILILPWLGNLFHLHGYWFTDGKDQNGEKTCRVSSFVVKNNKLSFFPVDWCFQYSKRKAVNDFNNLYQDAVTNSFMGFNKEQTDDSHKINIGKVMSFYWDYLMPVPSIFLKTKFNSVLDNNKNLKISQRIFKRLSYNQISMLPLYIMHIVRNINSKYQREELKYFDYKDEAVKRNDTDTSFYNYRIINLNKQNLTSTRYERSVNTNKWHMVRGFTRHYKSGKQVWIHSHSRGDKSKGVIEKDYVT